MAEINKKRKKTPLELFKCALISFDISELFHFFPLKFIIILKKKEKKLLVIFLTGK